MRVLKGRAATLRHTFLDEDEETPLVLTSVSVTVTNAVGEEVVSGVAATDEGAGVWSVSLSPLPLGEYRAVWSASGATDDTYFEVVGGHMFTVPQARKSDDFLADAADFPAAEIIAYREVVEGDFQSITGRSFTTRLRHLHYVADGTTEFVALAPDAQSVDAVWIDGEQVADVSGWQVNPLGKVTAPNPVDDGAAVTIAIRYGFTTPPPGVRRAGMVYLRHMMAAESSGVPDRATTWQPEEGGTFRLATPGSGPWRTGIPEVDSTLKNYALDVVMAVFAGG